MKLDWDELGEIKNNPSLTEKQKQDAAYEAIWGVSFKTDLLVRFGFFTFVVALAITAVWLLETYG